MVQLTKNLPQLIQVVVKTHNDLQLLLDYSKGSFFSFQTTKNDSRISTVICVFPKNKCFSEIYILFPDYGATIYYNYVVLQNSIPLVFFCKNVFK